jgi:hypothetical protein
VDKTGQAMIFPTVEAALVFLRTDLRIPSPHVFNY